MPLIPPSPPLRTSRRYPEKKPYEPRRRPEGSGCRGVTSTRQTAQRTAPDVSEIILERCPLRRCRPIREETERSSPHRIVTCSSRVAPGRLRVGFLRSYLPDRPGETLTRPLAYGRTPSIQALGSAYLTVRRSGIYPPRRSSSAEHRPVCRLRVLARILVAERALVSWVQRRGCALPGP
jgi:hypothetical protein